MYFGSKHRDMFKREQTAYQKLEGSKCQHIVGYYGSFEQEDPDGGVTYNLLLEHVDGLNLEQFLQENQPPQSKTELLKLWTSFLGILKALHHIHNLERNRTGNASDFQM